MRLLGKPTRYVACLEVEFSGTGSEITSNIYSESLKYEIGNLIALV